MLIEQPPACAGESLEAGASVADCAIQRHLDLMALRAILSGQSPIDLTRMGPTTRSEVDHLLRLLEFDTDNPLDLRYLRNTHRNATQYLAEHLGYQLPDQVLNPAAIHDLFLAALNESGTLRQTACMTLKIMHILHHLNARELMMSAAVSESQLLDRMHAKVFDIVDRMRASGIAVHEFQTGKKTRHSQVSKLLAQTDLLPSQMFDKLRFRAVVATREDLVLTLVYLARKLTPFNYVVPGQSQNGIITLQDVVGALDVSPELVQQSWDGAQGLVPRPNSPPATPPNAFSGESFRCVSFVADIPVRVDDLVDSPPPAAAFLQAEIQLTDAETNDSNNRGDNAYLRYKERQAERIRQRLEGVPAKAVDIV